MATLNEYEKVMSDACDALVAEQDKVADLRAQLQQRHERIADLERTLIRCIPLLAEASRDYNRRGFTDREQLGPRLESVLAEARALLEVKP